MTFLSVLHGGGVSYDAGGPHTPANQALADRLSAFNWCNPFDYVLPVADGSMEATDLAHLWGVFSGIDVGAPSQEFPIVVREVNVVTATDVANVALVELGAEPIQSITEDSPRAQKIFTVWHIFRRAFLAKHSWGKAKRTRAIAAEATAPTATRWQRKYRLPHNCVKPLTVNGEQNAPGRERWEIELDDDEITAYLYSDADSPIQFEYIMDVTDIGSMGPQTVEAMGVALAARVARQFHLSAADAAALEQRASDMVRVARSNDSAQSAPRYQVDTSMVDARSPGSWRGGYVGRGRAGEWTHG